MKTKTDAVLAFGQCLFLVRQKDCLGGNQTRTLCCSDAPGEFVQAKLARPGKTAFYSQDHIRDHLRFVYCLTAASSKLPLTKRSPDLRKPPVRQRAEPGTPLLAENGTLNFAAILLAITGVLNPIADAPQVFVVLPLLRKYGPDELPVSDLPPRQRTCQFRRRRSMPHQLPSSARSTLRRLPSVVLSVRIQLDKSAREAYS